MKLDNYKVDKARVVFYMAHQRVTQTALARKMCVSRPYLANMLAGRRPVSGFYLDRMCSGLGVDRQYLLPATREPVVMSEILRHR